MRTLDRLAFDKARCFSGGQESLLDRMCDIGEQLLIFMAGASRVTTKGMALRVEDGVFHRYNDRGLYLLTCHDGHGPFCGLLNICSSLTPWRHHAILDRESQGYLTGSLALNASMVSPRHASKRNKVCTTRTHYNNYHPTKPVYKDLSTKPHFQDDSGTHKNYENASIQ